jgi:putative transposase
MGSTLFAACHDRGVQPYNGRVRLSKIGEVKIKLHRPLEGEAKTLTVSQDRLGNWYACFVVEVEDRPLAPSPYTS